MKLQDISKSFDDEVFADIDNSNTTFLGQVGPYAEGTRSGAATVRRVLSVDEAVEIPTNKVIKHVESEQVYILGHGAKDFWKNGVIRVKYPMLPVDQAVSYGDMGNILSDVGLTTGEYAFHHYVRRVIAEEESSEFLSGHELYFRDGLGFAIGDLVKYDASNYYRVRNDPTIDGAGFGLCETVRIVDPLITATYLSLSGKTYDPETDTYIPTTITNVSMFVEYLKFNFEFISPAFEEGLPGDKSISVLKSDVAVAMAGDTAGIYRVLSVRDGGTFWTLHARVP